MDAKGSGAGGPSESANSICAVSRLRLVFAFSALALLCGCAYMLWKAEPDGPRKGELKDEATNPLKRFLALEPQGANAEQAQELLDAMK